MSNDLSHIGGQIPDKAYVGTAGSPNHVQGLASMTEQSVREQIRAKPDEVFGNANKSFLAQILSTAVKFVGDVIKGLVSVIESIFDVFSGPRDWGPVHHALYSQLKPMVDKTQEANNAAIEAGKLADAAAKKAEQTLNRAAAAESRAQEAIEDSGDAQRQSEEATRKAVSAQRGSEQAIREALSANTKADTAQQKSLEALGKALQANNAVDEQQQEFIRLQGEVNTAQQKVNESLKEFDAEIERTRPRVMVVPNNSYGKTFELAGYFRVEELVAGPGGGNKFHAQKVRVTCLGDWRGYLAITFKGDGGQFDIFGMQAYPGASAETKTGAGHVQWEGLIGTCYPT